MSVAASTHPNSAEELLQKMLELLLKIPADQRPLFARSQLAPKYPAFVRAFEKIPANRRRHSILFITATPHNRESRLAAAAKLAGWDTYLVSPSATKYKPEEHFNFHCIIPDTLALVLSTWLFPGALVHAFALRGDHLDLLARLKPHRLIIDLYDTIAGSEPKDSPVVQTERRVLATADAITHRDTRIKRLQRLRGYTLPRHNLFLHDPIPRATSTRLPSPRPDGSIHVVSIGWVGSGDSSILRTATALCAHGIHLHVYFNPLQTTGNEDARPYYELQKMSPFFHIHPQVYGDAYWAALAEYDFGLSPWEPFTFGEPMKRFSIDAIESCGSSRLSDYITAGLRVIITPRLRFQYFWARRYAAATVDLTPEFLANPTPALRAAIAAQSPRDLSRITVAAAAPRLDAFYKTLLP